MNKWLKKSIEIAEHKDYLDRLQDIYKLPVNKKRELDEIAWQNVLNSFKNGDDQSLVKALLELELFPIKHSFVSYFRRDPRAIDQNPKTVAEISRILYSMGIEEIKVRCEEPKETNRQIGPLFSNFLANTDFGIKKLSLKEFEATTKDALLIGSDKVQMKYAAEKLGYKRNKGLDFLARINNKYIIGEAKFLTDFGGHQNAQLDDAFSTLKAETKNAETILILDGVLYIPNTGKMYQSITHKFCNENIMSAVLLREYITEKLNEA